MVPMPYHLDGPKSNHALFFTLRNIPSLELRLVSESKEKLKMPKKKATKKAASKKRATKKTAAKKSAKKKSKK
jgi:hypothetical protein